MSSVTETVQLARTWLASGLAVILLVTSCTVHESVQKADFKRAALARGMSATEVNCAWEASAANSATQAQCVILATQNK